MDCVHTVDVIVSLITPNLRELESGFSYLVEFDRIKNHFLK